MQARGPRAAHRFQLYAVDPALRHSRGSGRSRSLRGRREFISATFRSIFGRDLEVVHRALSPLEVLLGDGQIPLYDDEELRNVVAATLRRHGVGEPLTLSSYQVAPAHDHEQTGPLMRVRFGYSNELLDFLNLVLTDPRHPSPPSTAWLMRCSGLFRPTLWTCSGTTRKDLEELSYEETATIC